MRPFLRKFHPIRSFGTYSRFFLMGFLFLLFAFLSVFLLVSLEASDDEELVLSELLALSLMELNPKFASSFLTKRFKFSSFLRLPMSISLLSLSSLQILTCDESFCLHFVLRLDLFLDGLVGEVAVYLLISVLPFFFLSVSASFHAQPVISAAFFILLPATPFLAACAQFPHPGPR